MRAELLPKDYVKIKKRASTTTPTYLWGLAVIVPTRYYYNVICIRLVTKC